MEDRSELRRRPQSRERAVFTSVDALDFDGAVLQIIATSDFPNVPCETGKTTCLVFLNFPVRCIASRFYDRVRHFNKEQLYLRHTNLVFGRHGK